ncbi:MAG: hypothetical protein KAQ85_04680 [Thermodesulfovibrionia bacterium]|nr:hypothetical protein [Thermodesulfovibrionia bacterium]
MPDTTVRSHERVGTKGVKRHLRRVKKDYDRSVNPIRDKLEIIELDDIGVIEVPAEIYNQIQAGVTTPIEGLKSIGFNDIHLQELFELNGISERGEAIIRNSTNGALQKIQVYDLSSPRSPPSTRADI